MTNKEVTLCGELDNCIVLKTRECDGYMLQTMHALFAERALLPSRLLKLEHSIENQMEFFSLYALSRRYSIRRPAFSHCQTE